jgi:hypothetical protein
VHAAEPFDVWNMHMPLLDPALIAAAAGTIVVAEPTPGPAGHATRARLSRLAGREPLAGAIMMPIRPHGRLFGVLEIGRAAPFRSAEIASIKALVDALVIKLEGWGG